MSATYLAGTDEKFAVQLANFAGKIEAYADTFGLTAAEVQGAKDDAAYFGWAVNNVEKIVTYKQNWTVFKNILKKGQAGVAENLAPQPPLLDAEPQAMPPGVLVRFTTLVNRIKAHQNYTAAIGQNLGIEMGAAQKPDMVNAQPMLTAQQQGDHVHLVWKKKGYGGILIEKDGGNGFATLDKDYHPDFIDPTPLPPAGQGAVWKYRAIYLVNDEKTGKWSDTVSVAVGK